jgi:DNA polymerase-1
MAKWLVADLETTTHTSFKRKANPFDPRNWVVMAGWMSNEDKLPQGRRYAQLSQTHEWLFKFLTGPEARFLVGANIKFDLFYLMRDPIIYAAWQDFVARGGLVWDVLLAEYLLEGQAQASQMLSLDDVSVRYGGDLKVDEVKKLWEAGVPTEEIDPDLLARYLLGETLPSGERVEGDIGNTRRAFLGQLERARSQGQSRSIMLNMGALCASIEMERNGMYVDKDLGYTLAAELGAELGEAREELAKYLPEGLPFEFNWTNRYHLSPIIFGGTVKYQRREYTLKSGHTTFDAPTDGNRGLYACTQRDEVHYILADGTTMECSWYEHIRDTEWGGEEPSGKQPVVVLSGKNKGEPKTKKVKVDDYSKPKSRWADCYWEFPRVVEPEPEWESSTPGLYSVSSDVLEALKPHAREVPFLDLLLRVKGMEKDLSTYFIDMKADGTEVGMLTLVQDGWLIHHSIHHNRTVTARLSSSDPNLQNIPKGNKSKVKQVFVSRFPGGYIGQSDFSSLEVYIQAILTGSVNLIADLRKGLDLHCVRLAAKEHMEYEDVLKLCKGYVDSLGVYQPAVDEWDYKRTGAKVFSFQRAYGAGAATIAKATGMPLSEVEALIAAEQARYPEIDAYFEARTDQIKRSRVPTDRRVPHPDMPAVIVQLGKGTVTTPDGKRYTYMESPSPKFAAKRGEFASFSPTEIKNYEVQGGGGEWMKAAMWLAVREFYRTRNFGGLALLVNTVHDALYWDMQEAVRFESGVCVAACMEAASDFMSWWFSWDIPLPVPTDTVYGANMGEENKYADEGYKAAVADYRTGLRARYMQGFVPSYLN